MSRLPRIRCIDHVTRLVRSEIKDGDCQTVSVYVILNHHNNAEPRRATQISAHSSISLITYFALIIYKET